MTIIEAADELADAFDPAHQAIRDYCRTEQEAQTHDSALVTCGRCIRIENSLGPSPDNAQPWSASALRRNSRVIGLKKKEVR